MSFYKLTVLLFLIFLGFGNLSSQTYTANGHPVYSDAEIELRIKNLSGLAVTPQLDRVVKSYIKTYSVLKRDKSI